MYCVNCKTEWKEEEKAPGEALKVWVAEKVIRDYLAKVGMPLIFYHTTLDLFSSMADCCKSPNIYWHRPKTEGGEGD